MGFRFGYFETLPVSLGRSVVENIRKEAEEPGTAFETPTTKARTDTEAAVTAAAAVAARH